MRAGRRSGTHECCGTAARHLQHAGLLDRIELEQQAPTLG
jgi:hypothetical protein